MDGLQDLWPMRLTKRLSKHTFTSVRHPNFDSNALMIHSKMFNIAKQRVVDLDNLVTIVFTVHMPAPHM
jgi:hypothetical protein